MTCGGRASRSGPADDADGSGTPEGGPTDENEEDDVDGEGTGLLEHVADAVGELWDDEPDEP